MGRGPVICGKGWQLLCAGRERVIGGERHLGEEWAAMINSFGLAVVKTFLFVLLMLEGKRAISSFFF